jgi:acyl-CoA reductase-like NAD-dependent aldehyde dehydrogenase
MACSDRLYLGGAWVPSASGDWIEVENPATETVIGQVPGASETDVDAAVKPARSALAEWSAVAPVERAQFLRRIAAELHAREDTIAKLSVAEIGVPTDFAQLLHAAVPPLIFEAAAATAEGYCWEEPFGDALLMRHPVGVVGAITPWNFPLQDIACKAGAALAAGCTIVIKPSELAPLATFELASAAAEAGLPPGVLNLVTGTGPVAGAALATHPEVDMISFTGSTGTGRRVAELAGRTVKRLTLELSGKSACILADDLDGPALERAVRDTVGKAFVNSGQNCVALCRMLAPAALIPAVEALCAQAASEQVVGDPAAAGVTFGPLISATLRNRVVAAIRRALADGASVVTGGPEPPAGLERGYFVRPTVLSRVHPGMPVATEELFGPVIVLLPYHGDDEAVATANGTPFGLNAAVWSGDPDRALRIARRLHVGQVEVNGGSVDFVSPFGGCKQSGYGREMGRFGMEEYLSLKIVQPGGQHG